MSGKTNVIWILVDQMRSQAMGCNGDSNAITPNLDQMAQYGVNFRNAVGGFPLCCPYRGALISGIYPHKCVPGHEYQMSAELPSVADVFNENGYDTAYFGKWHLDGWHERDGRAALHVVPRERRARFKTWLGYENNNSQWDSYVHGHDGDGNEYEPYQLPGFETNCLTDMLLDYLKVKADRKQSFFAVLSVQPPHNPYTVPAETMRNYNPACLELRPNVPDIPDVLDQAKRELAGYYALIENIDINVGRIVDALHELKLDKNTEIIFFSDHGDMHGSHGQFRKMTPHEEAIRVPFLMFGGRSEYNGRCGVLHSAPVNHVDVAPTSLGLCGIEIPSWMEGYDYSSVRTTKEEITDAPDSAYLQSVIPTGHNCSVDKPWRGIVTVDGWKYVCLENCEWLLFNLNDDPYEQRNLAHDAKYRGRRRELMGRLRKWVRDTGDEFSLPDV